MSALYSVRTVLKGVGRCVARPVALKVQSSSASKCTSPPRPAPGRKVWARTPPSPSNGAPSSWSETDDSHCPTRSCTQALSLSRSLFPTDLHRVSHCGSTTGRRSQFPLRSPPLWKEMTMSASLLLRLWKRMGVTSAHSFHAALKALLISEGRAAAR